MLMYSLKSINVGLGPEILEMLGEKLNCEEPDELMIEYYGNDGDSSFDSMWDEDFSGDY